MTVNDNNECFVAYGDQKLTRDATDPDKWFVQYDNKNWELLVDAEEESVYFDGMDFTISEIEEGLAEWVCGPPPPAGVSTIRLPRPTRFCASTTPRLGRQADRRHRPDYSMSKPAHVASLVAGFGVLARLTLCCSLVHSALGTAQRTSPSVGIHPAIPQPDLLCGVDCANNASTLLMNRHQSVINQCRVVP